MNENEVASQEFPKRIGLAIGGGFIRSAAAIGVLEVLEENKIPIHLLSGCSAGSGIADAYTTGNLSALKKRLLEPAREYWKIIFEELTKFFYKKTQPLTRGWVFLFRVRNRFHLC